MPYRTTTPAHHSGKRYTFQFQGSGALDLKHFVNVSSTMAAAAAFSVSPQSSSSWLRGGEPKVSLGKRGARSAQAESRAARTAASPARAAAGRSAWRGQGPPARRARPGPPRAGSREARTRLRTLPPAQGPPLRATATSAPPQPEARTPRREVVASSRAAVARQVALRRPLRLRQGRLPPPACEARREPRRSQQQDLRQRQTNSQLSSCLHTRTNFATSTARQQRH